MACNVLTHERIMTVSCGSPSLIGYNVQYGARLDNCIPRYFEIA